jgi:hypothetical protein
VRHEAIPASAAVRPRPLPRDPFHNQQQHQGLQLGQQEQRDLEEDDEGDEDNGDEEEGFVETRAELPGSRSTLQPAAVAAADEAAAGAREAAYAGMTHQQRLQAELDAEVEDLFDDDDLPDDIVQARAATGASRAAKPVLQSHRTDWPQEEMPQELQDDMEDSHTAAEHQVDSAGLRDDNLVGIGRLASSLNDQQQQQHLGIPQQAAAAGQQQQAYAAKRRRVIEEDDDD